MPTLAQLLYPQVIFESVINRVKKVNNTLQRFWGIEMGSKNVERIPGRVGSYDIFDSVRRPANGRAPNTGPASIPANAIHQQPVTCLRVHEKMPLLYERIFPIRRLGRPSSMVDPGGADYIERQKGILRTGFDNMREFLTSGLMLGTCQILVSGENWIPVYSGGTFTISWQIPSSNTGQLPNPYTSTNAISSTWLNTTNAQVFEDVLAVNALSYALTGYPIKHVWCSSIIWGYVTNNAGLKARSGTANVVFSMWDGLGRQLRPGEEYAPDEFQAELRALPGIRWHIYDGGLEINNNYTPGTGFTPFFGATTAVFSAEPSPELVTMIEGTEFVQENEWQPAQEQNMPYFWPQYVREPAKIELVGLDIVMPALKVPKSLFPATVVF